MNILFSKLALGTAQFGLDYGINNTRGKIPEREVFSILDEAILKGIHMIDTSPKYGNSENVLGKYFKLSNKDNLKVISKLPKCDITEIYKYLTKSLDNLGIDKLYAYLVHDFNSFKEDIKVWDVLKELKKENKIEKIGFSLYHEHELDFILDKNLSFDLLQVPYNIFDRRFEKYFTILKQKKIEIHTRSTFLQGLFFKDVESLTPNFNNVKEKLKNLHLLAKNSKISIEAICLDYVCLSKFIDHVIVGIDSLDNLKGLIKAVDSISIIEKIKEKIEYFKEDDLNIILPIKWRQE